MGKWKYIGFRATDEERSRIEALTLQTGMNVSEVLRTMVANVEIRRSVKLEPTTRLGKSTVPIQRSSE